MLDRLSLIASVVTDDSNELKLLGSKFYSPTVPNSVMQTHKTKQNQCRRISLYARTKITFENHKHCLQSDHWCVILPRIVDGCTGTTKFWCNHARNHIPSLSYGWRSLNCFILVSTQSSKLHQQPRALFLGGRGFAKSLVRYTAVSIELGWTWTADNAHRDDNQWEKCAYSHQQY